MTDVLQSIGNTSLVRLRPSAAVVTLLCDSGLKYWSTELFRSSAS